MGIKLNLVDYRSMIANLRQQPLVINFIADNTEEQKSAINNEIYTRCTTEFLAGTPSCSCGKTVGEYNEGVVCPHCGTKAETTEDPVIQSLLWVKAPEGVAPFINPLIWTMLKMHFTKSGFEAVRYLCDTTYNPDMRYNDVKQELERLEIPRGYTYFVHHFKEITEQLFEMRAFKPRKRKLSVFRQLLIDAGDQIFTEYYPLLNKAILVVEETNFGTYVDTSVVNIIDAIRTMVGIEAPGAFHSTKVKENRTVKTMIKLSEAYEVMYRTYIAKKEGVYRKHVFGSRCHFSFRAVVSSLTDVHEYDELHIPWGIGVTAFALHLKNKLLRRGFTPNEAAALLNKATALYDPMINDLFQELLREAPGGKISAVLQRNPSLERASAQAMYITKVKTDVTDQTISFSILSVKGFNADFDGDALNCTLSLDNNIAAALLKLAPHMSAVALSGPEQISKNISFPNPVIASIANWIAHANDDHDQVKRQAMRAYYV